MSHKLRLTLIILAAAAIVCGFFAAFGMVTPAQSAWISDLKYGDSEIQPLTFTGGGVRSCPLIPVTINGKVFDMTFDTGCSVGIFFTDVMADSLEYTTLGTTEEVNRDGSHRGWSERVRVDSFSVCGEDYHDVETTMSDWSMYSSSPFNGCVGLEYFAGQVVTLDYASSRFAVSSTAVDYSKLPAGYIVLPLHRSTSRSQETLLFFEAELDGEPVMVYLDTGKNYSYVYDADSASTIAGKPGDFCDVELTIGGQSLTLKDVAKASDMAQADGMPYPTRIELNSDQIWKNHMVVTLDLISQKIVLKMQ